MGWCGGPCRYQSLWSRAVGRRASLRSDGLGFEVGGFGRPASEAMGIGTVGHGSTWLWERMQAQPRSRRGRSMTKVLGPCWLHVGRGGRFWKRSCCGLIVALHLKQTHSGCHVLVDGWWTGAQAKCRKSGSSSHASSSSALAAGVDQQKAGAAQDDGVLGWWRCCRDLGCGRAHSARQCVGWLRPKVPLLAALLVQSVLALGCPWVAASGA